MSGGYVSALGTPPPPTPTLAEVLAVGNDTGGIPIDFAPGATPANDPTRLQVFCSDGSGALTLGGLYAIRLDGSIHRLDITYDAWGVSTDYNSNSGNYRDRMVGGTVMHNFNSRVPSNVQPTAIYIVGFPAAGAPGAGKQIDYFCSYGAPGELKNNHTGSRVGATFTIPAVGTIWELNVLALPGLFNTPPIAPGDYFGLRVDHNGIGGAVEYIGVRIEGRYV